MRPIHQELGNPVNSPNHGHLTRASSLTKSDSFESRSTTSNQYSSTSELSQPFYQPLIHYRLINAPMVVKSMMGQASAFGASRDIWWRGVVVISAAFGCLRYG